MRPALTIAGLATAAALCAAGCSSNDGTTKVSGQAQPVGGSASSSGTTAGTPAATPTDAPVDSPSATPAPSTADTTAPPATTASTLDLAGGQRYVSGRGYDPLVSNWQNGRTLNVIVGLVHGGGDGHNQRAFFFAGGRPIGTDTSDPSADMRIVSATDDTVSLRYGLYTAKDALCCPSSFAAVRYHWTGSKLVPLDPIPPADSSTAPSRG